jgi:hypothetical protein
MFRKRHDAVRAIVLQQRRLNGRAANFYSHLLERRLGSQRFQGGRYAGAIVCPLVSVAR